MCELSDIKSLNAVNANLGDKTMIKRRKANQDELAVICFIASLEYGFLNFLIL